MAQIPIKSAACRKGGKVYNIIDEKPLPAVIHLSIQEINNALVKVEKSVDPDVPCRPRPRTVMKGRVAYKLDVYKAKIAVKVTDLQARMDKILRNSKEWMRLRKQILALRSRLNRRIRLANNKEMYTARESYITGALRIVKESTPPGLFS